MGFRQGTLASGAQRLVELDKGSHRFLILNLGSVDFGVGCSVRIDHGLKLSERSSCCFEGCITLVAKLDAAAERGLKIGKWVILKGCLPCHLMTPMRGVGLLAPTWRLALRPAPFSVGHS